MINRPLRRRMVRNEPPPDDLVVVIRAAAATFDATIDDIATDAEASARVYSIEVPDGAVEALYGVSVFAQRRQVAGVLDRFSGAPTYLSTTVGRLRSKGFAVWPTGANPDQFDVQLVAGRGPDDSIAPASVIVDEARRFAGTADGPQPNPGYAGRRPDSPELS